MGGRGKGVGGLGSPSAGLALAALAFVGPAALLLAYLQTHPFFHARYFLPFSAGYYLVLGFGVVGLWRLFWPAGLATAMGLLLAFGAGAQAYFFDPTFAKDDTRAAGEFLRREARPDDLILAYQVHPFRYYYRGPAAVGFLPASPTAGDGELTRLATGRQRVFWEQSDLVDNDPWGVVPFLLNRVGEAEAEHIVRGYRQIVYRLPSTETTFHLGPWQPPASARRFGDALELEGFVGPALSTQHSALSTPSDRPVTAAMRFTVLRPPPAGRAYKAFVHLRDDQGRLVAQGDSFLVAEDRTRAWALQAGQEAFAFFALRPAAGTGPGRYRVEAGAYEVPASPSARATPEAIAQLTLVGGARAVYDLGTIELGPPRRPWPAEMVAVGRPLDLAGTVVRTLGLEGPLATAEPPGPSVRPGERVDLGVIWQKLGPGAPDRVGLWLEPAAGGQRPEAGWETIGPASYPLEQWRPGEVLRERRSVAFAPDVPAGAYRLVLGLSSADGRVSTAVVGPLTVAGRPRYLEPPVAEANVVPVPTTPATRWREGGREAIELWGYRVTRPGAGEDLALEVWWRALASMGESYTVFVHLVGPDGQIEAQSDRLPQGGETLTTGWIPGEFVADRHVLARKPGARGGRYRILVGWYQARSGQRLELVTGKDSLELLETELGAR